MSVNNHVRHVLVLPEDDANRQLANGFQLDHALDTRRMQVLGVAGGWVKVVDSFKEEHIPVMDRNANRYMVLLIDCDKRGDRLDKVRAEIPERLKERVFVLGAWTKPEELRQALGPYDVLLRHNAGELERLREHVRPILFPNG
jgi:hypothetical protein